MFLKNNFYVTMDFTQVLASPAADDFTIFCTF